MKSLNGSELAEFIKERQAHQVRALRQAHDIFPKLAIVVTVENPVIETYMRLKCRYGEDILIDVDIHRVKQTEVQETLNMLSNDKAVHGVIVQLPLEDVSQTDEIVNMVPPEKDVDALGQDAKFDPATPMAIMWLLAGHNIDLRGKRVLLVGRGKLVGAPLEKILKESDVDVHVVDRGTKDLKSETLQADIIITATGSPAVLKSDMIKSGAVVVDAGVASESGKTVGDLAEDVYERDDISL
ncbi:MAG TPA: bifunctional 5,10-methylenetetrahydrofolate dehydrogenase/5,10-methenyltetrahydrofolate cyclohydrolase, partial [Candidatus Saccharimonadales bacterium]|nr:bifunctional 5,10-methylenetetrahydrofolate dehydrogenase/5,10-methenyltetrahydrofolate cyclohydrolase [Candidatus Saccharimonadales bacterium]